MKFTPESAAQKLGELQTKMFAYSFAQNSIYLDSVTAAPRDTSEGRARALGVLSEEEYKLFVNDETGALLEYILANADSFDRKTFREAEQLKESYDEMTKIPMNEYVDYQMLVSEAEIVRAAQQRASEIVSAAQTEARTVRQTVTDYCDNMLKTTEETMSENAAQVKSVRANLRQTPRRGV